MCSADFHNLLWAVGSSGFRFRFWHFHFGQYNIGVRHCEVLKQFQEPNFPNHQNFRQIWESIHQQLVHLNNLVARLMLHKECTEIKDWVRSCSISDRLKPGHPGVTSVFCTWALWICEVHASMVNERWSFSLNIEKIRKRLANLCSSGDLSPSQGPWLKVTGEMLMKFC